MLWVFMSSGTPALATDIVLLKANESMAITLTDQSTKTDLTPVGVIDIDTTLRTQFQSITGQVGTTGGRLFYNRVVGRSQRWMVRGGINYFGYHKPVRIKVDKGSYLTLQPDLVIGMAEVGARWQVFPRRTLYFTGGFTYNWHPYLNTVIQAENTLTFGGLQLTPENIGIVNLGLRWKTIMPYLGFGFGRPSPKRRVSAGFELGVFYMGKPRIDLAYTGFLETTTIDEQVPKVERNMSGYRYLPSLNFSLTYRLSKRPPTATKRRPATD